MKNFKKLTTIILSLILTISSVSYIYADEDNTSDSDVEKQETVYAFLDANGNFKSATVSEWLHSENGFNNVKDESILSDIKNLKGDEEPTINGNSLTWNSNSSDIYYQGTTTKQLPLTMQVTYYFNGQKVNIEDVVGESGKLEVHIKLINNQEKTEVINGKTRHISTLFPCVIVTDLKTDIFEDVSADGAIVVNESKNQVVSFVTVSGASKLLNDSSITELDEIKDKLKDEFVVKANVTDLEMPSIYCAVSGSLDLDDNNFSSEDLDKLKNGINDLQDAMNEILDGSSDLKDAVSGDLSKGVNDLDNGAGDLKDGASKLKDGASQIYSGSTDLKNGLAELVSYNDQLNGGAYSIFTELCSTAQDQINAKLTANGLSTIELTPSNYSEVLMNLLKQFDADEVYKQAYAVALEKVTEEVTKQVNENADALYQAYINSIADSIYTQYVESQITDEVLNNLYKQAVVQTITNQLKEAGKNEDEISAYLASEEGQQAIQEGITSLDDETKTTIKQAAINSTLSSLSDEQKAQILAGALAKLTDDQKTEIRNTYINQKIEETMESEDVQNQIKEAVSKVSDSAAEITELKGKLDSVNYFYNSLLSYTSGVSSAYAGSKTLAAGASSLYDGSKSLYDGASTLKDGTASLKDGVADLNDGVNKLDDGLNEFNTEGVKELSDKVNSAIGDLDDVKDVVNKVLDESNQYTNYAGSNSSMATSVKLIMKTDEVSKKEENETKTETTVEVKEESTTFWQRLVNLFKKSA